MYEIYLVHLDSYFLISLQQPWSMIPEKFRILRAKKNNEKTKIKHVTFCYLTTTNYIPPHTAFHFCFGHQTPKLMHFSCQYMHVDHSSFTFPSSSHNFLKRSYLRFNDGPYWFSHSSHFISFFRFTFHIRTE